MTGLCLHRVTVGCPPLGMVGVVPSSQHPLLAARTSTSSSFRFPILKLEALPKDLHQDKMRHLSKGMQMLLLLVVLKNRSVMAPK